MDESTTDDISHKFPMRKMPFLLPPIWGKKEKGGFSNGTQ
jgi:hypothetical protein